MESEKRLIDANELVETLNHTTMVAYPNLFPGLLAAAEIVEDAPTVDAVEVVRCKDCVNYCGFEHCKNGICDVDSVSKRAVYPNDFCSYGERRTYNG